MPGYNGRGPAVVLTTLAGLYAIGFSAAIWATPRRAPAADPLATVSSQLIAEIEAAPLYVPGAMRCPYCGFNCSTIRAHDEPIRHLTVYCDVCFGVSYARCPAPKAEAAK